MAYLREIEGVPERGSSRKERKGQENLAMSQKKEQQKSSKHSSTKGSTTIRLLKQKRRQKAAKDVKKTHSKHIQMFRKEGTHFMRAAELGDGRGRRFSKGYQPKRATEQL
jgi:hypothetical protein